MLASLALEPLLDSSPVSPLVFATILFLAVVVLLSLPPACSLGGRRGDNGPIRPTGGVLGTIVAFYKSLRRSYTLDGMMGVARCVGLEMGVVQWWRGSLLRGVYARGRACGEVEWYWLLVLAITLYFTQVNLGAPVCAYVSGLWTGFVNGSARVRESGCDFVRAGEIVSPVQHRWQNARLQHFYCDGELDGVDMRAEWGPWIEDQLYTWEMFHLLFFAALVSLVFLYTFMVWMVIRLRDFDYVVVRKAHLTAMQAGTVNPRARTPTKKAKKTRARSPAITNETQSSPIADMLCGRIRYLEGCALASRSRNEALEQIIRDKDVSLASLRQTIEELRRVNTRECENRQHLPGINAQTAHQKAVELASRLQSAQAQMDLETMRQRLVEDRYKTLRRVAGDIADKALYHHLADLDRISEQCDVEGLDLASRKLRLEHMQKILKNKLPYLQQEVEGKALAYRKANCDERIANDKIAALERHLEQARAEIRSLATDNTSRRAAASAASTDVAMLTKANADLAEMRTRLDKAVADLDVQRRKTVEAVHLHECERTQHDLVVAELDEKNRVLVSRSSQIEGLEAKLRDAARHSKDSTTTMTLEIESLREKLEVMGRANVNLEGELHDARCRVEDLEVDVMASELHIAEMAIPQAGEDSGLALAMQQQLDSSMAREVALSQELDTVKALLQHAEAQQSQFQERSRQEQESLIAPYKAALASKDAEHAQQIGHLQAEAQTLNSELQQLRARVQERQANSAALAGANAKVVELQACINGLTKQLDQLRQAPKDDLARQQIEKLRSRVHALETSERDLLTDKSRLGAKARNLEEDLRKATIKLSTSKETVALNPRNHGKINPLRGKFDKLTQEHDKVVKDLEASDATIKSIQNQLRIGNLQKEDHVSLIRLLRDEIDHVLATRVPIVTAAMHASSIGIATKRGGEPLEAPAKRHRAEGWQPSQSLSLAASLYGNRKDVDNDQQPVARL
ncbi:hypothetical protein FQN52_003795 [Onygenales sp. PD_12]|nr:hypothetical protein FQN52_003795 [Onygenales sp. PD_12]